MYKSCLFRKWRLLLTLVLLLSAFAGPEASAADPLEGRWRIYGELVTQASDDPYAPKPGTQVQDVWAIGLTNNGHVLQTTKVSLMGKPIQGGVRFQGDAPFHQGLRVRVTIDIGPDGAGGIYGTEEIVYYSTTNPIWKMEAWKFRGSRQ